MGAKRELHDERSRRFNTAVGAAVRRLRRERGMHGDVLAERIGMGRTTMFMRETGRRPLTLYETLRCASILHVPLAALLKEALEGDRGKDAE